MFLSCIYRFFCWVLNHYFVIPKINIFLNHFHFLGFGTLFFSSFCHNWCIFKWRVLLAHITFVSWPSFIYNAILQSASNSWVHFFAYSFTWRIRRDEISRFDLSYHAVLYNTIVLSYVYRLLNNSLLFLIYQDIH